MPQNIFAFNLRFVKMKYLVTDIMLIAFIYLLPTLSHLTNIPFYMFEPMRLAIVFCIINTNKNNSIIITLTLPLVSLLLSSHPDLIKSLLMMTELLINVVLFYALLIRINYKFTAMFVSILIAKIYYYGIKLMFINLGLMSGNLISTPIWIQVILILILSSLTVILLNNKNSKTETTN